MFVSTILVLYLTSSSAVQIYDSYHGTVLNSIEYASHIKKNTTYWCTQEVAPCDPNEYRRIDASCNNLKNPSRGTRHTPLLHLLPQVFDKDYEPRKSKSGESLPLSRFVRTTMLSEGRVPDSQFTHLLTYFMVFMSADVLSFHDTVNYLEWTPHCCKEKGKTDPVCIPIQIPDNDPVHRFSQHRCFNLTRPFTFQSTGCLDKKTTPKRMKYSYRVRLLFCFSTKKTKQKRHSILEAACDWTIMMDTYEKQYRIAEDIVVSSSRPDIFLYSRQLKRMILVDFTVPRETNIPKDHTIKKIVSATTFFDLSQIYVDNPKTFAEKGRLFKDGLLKYETEEGRVWMPSFKKINPCRLNQIPRETRCHDVGEDSINGILGTNLFSIWFWRHHNLVARKLSRINPCWDDERLFFTARDINIAFAAQIFLYEMHPILINWDYLYQHNILSPTLGFRDLYDENVMPQVSMEYGFILRWAHTIQEGVAKMYDNKGDYIKSMRIANLTLRTGYLANDNHIDYLTQGAFRQSGRKMNSGVDPDIAETGLGDLQAISDITTSDLEKNRYFGIAPYIHYRKLCFGETIETFDDLIQAMDQEKIILLKELYKDVEDIDLLAGAWAERGRVPASLSCIVLDQLRRTLATDRHWYERARRPHAFTIEQLLEIRKASVARLLCDVGDKVTEIQPRAFIVPGLGNEICSCDYITQINYEAWKDTC